jgi:pimeloyl-ACP methyl ester carboxylesterase
MRCFPLGVVALLLPLAAGAAHAAIPGWGKRSQVGQLIRALDAERQGTPVKTGFLRRNPLAQKVAAFIRPGLRVKDDVAVLEKMIADAEARFGRPISTLEHPALVDGRRMRAEKAMALQKYGRRPEEVSEELLRTTAKIEGAPEIADRDLFVQRWRPIGKPSGKVFVMAPGFLQSGRNFYEQVQLLNQAGHDVVVMDQQWAGYTADAKRGVIKGGIDRGHGIARDVAELAAYGNQILEREYGAHADKQLVVVGTSMGGGPGVLGALKLYDAGRIDLGPGRSIPKDRGWIIQGGFLGRRRTIINDVLDFFGRIPGLRRLALPAMGVPLLNDDKGTNVKLAAHAAAEDMRGRPQAFRAALKDIAEVRDMIAETGAPEGRGYFLHADKDHLANTQSILEVVAQMKRKGGAVELDLLPGRDHVIEETPGEQRRILDAARFVGGK